MSVLKGVSPKSWEEAVPLALQEARVEGMDPYAVGLFRWAVSVDELENAMRTVVGRVVRGKYGKRSEWSLQRGWYVPVARLSYSRDGVAQLTAKVDIHLVVNVRVQDRDHAHSACVVVRVGKLQTALLPIPLLWAVIEKDLDRFHVIAKDGPWTTREVPGAGQVVLHDEFLVGLATALARQPVDRVLERFGRENAGIIPLLRLDMVELVTGGQLSRPHLDLKGVEQAIIDRLGVPRDQAGGLMGRAGLRSDDSEEEALRKIMKAYGQGRQAMSEQMTPDEMAMAVRTARVTAPGTSDEEFAYIVELHRSLKDSGRLKAVEGLLAMERELGVPAAEAVPRYKQLVEHIQELQGREARAEENTAQAEKTAAQAQERAKTDTEAAQHARHEHQREERELAAFRQRAQDEKRRLVAEVEAARQKAGLDMAQVAMAVELNQTLEKRRLRLGFVADLVQEIPDDEGARQHLDTAIQEHGSLHQGIAKLREQKAALGEETLAVQQKKTGLEGDCQKLSEEKARLTADVAEVKRLRRFHEEYKDAPRLVAVLRSWGPVVFQKVQFPLLPPHRIIRPAEPPLPSPYGPSIPWTWDLEAYKTLGVDPQPVTFV